VIARSPAGAPPRRDLPWLRHRSLRSTPPTGAGAPATAAVADFFSGRATHHRHDPAPAAPAPAPAPTSSLDLSPPARSSLDLSPPEPTTPPAPSAPSALDLSAPAPSTLDLSSPDLPAAQPPAVPAGPGPARPSRRPVPRVTPGGRTILTPRDPTVTLNRIQSGVGTLTFDAVCSPAVGDIRIGALYQLADGTSSVVSRAAGIPTAPPGARRPVVLGQLGEYDRLVVDLRQSRSLARLLVYAFSESGRELAWGGTLVGTTFGGARVELPLDLGAHLGPIALLSLYNVDGEYVLRAETEKVDGPVREVARRYGYDRITWADDAMPVL
jgi:hypothetical protein